MTIAEALALLEVSLPITQGELKKAYRHALIVWHPDRFQGTPELLEKATNKTRAINEAFEFLGRHTSAAESQKQAPPPFRNEPRPEEKQKPEPERSKTEHTRAAPQGGDAVTKTTGPSFWQWLLCLIACLPAFYLAKLGVQAARGRQQAAATSARLPSPSHTTQSPSKQNPPRARLANCSFPSHDPSIQLSLTLPENWQERPPLQSDTVLKIANPNLSAFVVVRYRRLTVNEAYSMSEWSKGLGSVPNGTAMQKDACIEFLPKESLFVSAMKTDVDWRPSVAAVWEKQAVHEGEMLFTHCASAYLYINGCIVGIEFMVGGLSTPKGIEQARQEFASISPVFDEIFRSIKVSSLRVAETSSTSAPYPNQPVPAPASRPAPPIQAPLNTPLSVENQASKEELKKQNYNDRHELLDLWNDKFLVPKSQYAQLLSLRNKALTELSSDKFARVPASLKAERRELDEERRRLNRSLEKAGGRPDPTLLQQVRKLDAKDRDLQARTTEAASPSVSQFQKEIMRVGIRAK